MSVTRNVFFVDARISNIQSLVSTLPSFSEWFVLDADEDGIEQISSILSGYTDIDTIQIISHGAPGALYLGNITLDHDTLYRYAGQFGQIGASLSEKGDILLYGCNIGEGVVGQIFLSSLSELTGADIASTLAISGRRGQLIQQAFPVPLGNNEGVRVCG
ncbi:DUF4347 domain-containing protein [uncultured Lamprocystis sp.]|jgi:hypothetical protein|uniref:DUF4347 domain-containing protein n=1 Tax=uncultured Lamprocystis sp. TaxID=543132 RepID=UPI0025D20BCC|nr:DUF4347 domain-containing protein [uncultured Lamprocystis sp.]